MSVQEEAVTPIFTVFTKLRPLYAPSNPWARADEVAGIFCF